MARKRALHDPETGEVIEYRQLRGGVGVSALYGRQWMAANLPHLTKLAYDPEITGQTYRVLFCLLGELEEGNRIRVHNKFVADRLEIAPQRVSVALRLLRRKAILLGDERGGYRLHPRFGIRGSPEGVVRRDRFGELVFVP